MWRKIERISLGRIPRSAVPNAITLLGLVLGFVAMARAVQGDFLQSAWLLVVAAFLDVLDGRVATLLRATSEFGGELDSFTDLIAFCCAPAFLVYLLYFKSWGLGGILLGSLPVVCGALRLTRFNLAEHQSAGHANIGLTSPMAGALPVGFIIWTQSAHGADLPLIAAALTVIASLLMVSTIRFDSDAPFKPPPILDKWRGYWLISFFPAVAIFPRYAVFLWPAMLSCYGVLRWIYASLFARHRLHPADDAAVAGGLTRDSDPPQLLRT